MGLIRDPRMMQIILLAVYVIIGKTLLQFQFTFLQMSVTIIMCILLEWFFLYTKKGTIAWPYSAVITALGIVLLLRAHTVIPFMMASILAFGLKHLFRYRSSHIFNPSNIGVVGISLLFPMSAATDPLQWGFYLWILTIMSMGGLYLVYKVGRMPLVVTFLLSFVAMQWIRHLIWVDAWNAKFSDFMWGGLFVFTFNMITDPKTSPKQRKAQVAFGFAIALVAQIMINLNVHGALFISLMLICMGKFLWKWIQVHGLFDRQPSI